MTSLINSSVHMYSAYLICVTKAALWDIIISCIKDSFPPSLGSNRTPSLFLLQNRSNIRMSQPGKKKREMLVVAPQAGNTGSIIL